MAIFSYTKTATHKIYKIFGLKFKRKIKRYLTEEQQLWLNKIIQLYSLPSINRQEIESKTENLRHSGVTDAARSPRLIVSLTSYPKRMYDIHLCLYSLLTQSLKPDKLILWLKKDEFPEGEADVPLKVKQLTNYGLEIRWCNNYKSYSKIIPALEVFPDDIIVTADDDIYYPADWLEKLYQSYMCHGKGIYAHRCHHIKLTENGIAPYAEWEKCVTSASASNRNFLTGVGGVLYAPHTLHPDVMNMEAAKALCPQADDIWLWAMCLLAGNKITLVENPINQLTYINPERELSMNNDGTLFSHNGAGGGNDLQLQRLLSAYSEIGAILMNEAKKESKCLN